MIVCTHVVIYRHIRNFTVGDLGGAEGAINWVYCQSVFLLLNQFADQDLWWFIWHDAKTCTYYLIDMHL